MITLLRSTKTEGRISGMFLVTISFAAIALRAVFVFHEDGCYGWPYDGSQVTILRMSYMVAFTTQSVALCIIFFLKLVRIFKDSQYAVSKGTKVMYSAMFLVFPIFVTTVMTMAWSLEKYFTLGFLVWIMSLMATLLILFIHKLLIVNRDCIKDPSERLSVFVDSVTKSTLLTVISVSLSVIDIIISAVECEQGIYCRFDINLHFHSLSLSESL